jgi:hypothetical protein
MAMLQRTSSRFRSIHISQVNQTVNREVGTFIKEVTIEAWNWTQAPGMATPLRSYFVTRYPAISEHDTTHEA